MANQLFLPAHLVGYIGSFIKINYDSNLLLNMYKAFESVACESVACESVACESVHGEGYEDPLRYYKAEVQAQLAALAMDGVLFEDCDAEYGLTQREIMYVFDCYYCDPAVIMYGEETYETIGATCLINTAQMQYIENEFLNCSAFTEVLERPYLGIRFGLTDAINIKMYKHIRLLEEALRLKSTALVSYMKDAMILLPEMLLYIYIKHNHQVYAPKWYSLAADELLLALCNTFDILPIVLAMAINGDRFHYAHCEEALTNTVLHNLAAVKQIVPRYISATSQVIMYEDYFDNNPLAQGVEFLTPYVYWLSNYYNSQVRLSPPGEPSRIIKVEGSEEIGAYLKGLE